MEIKIPIEELQQRKLFIATPMYGGQCHGMFTRSMNDLSARCARMNIAIRFYYLFNESLITRARNYCCDEFMRSDCTHLLFVDSDIGFDPESIFQMLALQSDMSDYDVLCGPYPKKCISWEKVKAAVDSGAADNNPNILEHFVGDYVFNPVNGGGNIPIFEPSEVMESGTGFMMIRKTSLQKFMDAHPEWMYKPDHVRTKEFDGSRQIMAYFHDCIDPVSRRWLSEDYFFCQEVRKLGMKVWICPWIQLQHCGSYVFGGSLQALASIGAAATADPSKLGGKREVNEAPPV